MKHLLRTVPALLAFLLSNFVAHAHNNVVVIPMAGEEALECLIIGADVDCVAVGRVVVPMDMVFDCSSFDIHTKHVNYKEAWHHVAFQIGSSTASRIEVRLEDYPSDRIYIGLRQYPGGPITIIEGEADGCNIPTISTSNNFVAAGSEWSVTPVFSSTPTAITLEELRFERQPQPPIGPFEAIGGFPDDGAVFVTMNFANGNISARVDDPSEALPTESLSFEADFSAVNFSGINGIWDSVSNTGVTPVAYPPGTQFTSTLVKGNDTYHLSATISDTGSVTITVDNLVIVKK